ncbi:triphosphoribosyl-dephospho-CoA synthase CitG [Sulfurospirillum arcachonense]|uniref:triphosphoribosyl-dephospho-CoA synthase CitG n=1 Tax=Sulfurospirillum arcachonense TaxID=57666 RepID=UPI0004B4B6AC|nr:triphosphoribosyl-dephospho-CoA synthase CitG [Sulfurospirillum arcachonense]
MITKLAYNALIKEVELTPKPGLVDKGNNGSHKDMNIQTFYNSAEAIKPFIDEFYKCGNDFDGLRKIGIECEKAMFLTTNGINTHKGMIFSLAVICGALGSVGYTCLKTLRGEIKYICKDLVQNDLEKALHVKTHGERFYAQTKSEGIRGEASRGYPTIFEKSLPFFLEQQNKYGEDIALKLTLLLLMSITEDSTLFARGGLEGLRFVQKEAKKLLHVKDISLLEDCLNEFDEVMIEKNLSAGGSADLLGLTWFLAQLDML